MATQSQQFKNNLVAASAALSESVKYLTGAGTQITDALAAGVPAGSPVTASLQTQITNVIAALNAQIAYLNAQAAA